MKNHHKFFRAVGYIWVSLSLIYVFYRYGMVVIGGEAPLVNRVLSFINIWNIFFAVIILLPGLICIVLSDTLGKKGNKK